LWREKRSCGLMEGERKFGDSRREEHIHKFTNSLVP
jgi:hypothetical protein